MATKPNFDETKGREFTQKVIGKTSLAAGGKGLGTIGLPEPKLQQLCLDAGFSSVRRAWEDPFRVLFEVNP